MVGGEEPGIAAMIPFKVSGSNPPPSRLNIRKEIVRGCVAMGEKKLQIDRMSAQVGVTQIGAGSLY